MISMMAIYSNLSPSLPKPGTDIFIPLYPKWDLILGSNPIMLGAPNIDPNTPLQISLLGKKWTYRGEGNMNLVLSLPEERVILRLHKCLGDNSSIGQQAKSNKTERERVWREAVFCHGIMVPLLGKAYIQPPQTACMELFEVLVLDSELRAQRPAFRHHKSLQYGYVTIYPDYALLPKHLEVPGISSTPTFCVEIKPKQGWLPPVDRRLSKCTFCLNQYLKAKKGIIRTRSSYCPLDLFSGIRTRMIKALKALLNNPQNNLKIFKNGVLVYDDDKVEQLAEVLSDWFGDSDAVDPHKKSRLIDYMCDLVLQALTRNLMVGCQKNQNFTNIYATWDRGCLELLRPFSVPAKPVPVYCNERVPSSLVDTVRPLLPLPSCDWKSEPLPSDCILDRILHAQKLEKYGGDRVYEMYCSWLEEVREQNEDESRDYEYISGMLTAGAGEGKGLSPIHRHLIATTAKDCSIMIAFQSLPSGFSKIELPSEHVAQGRDGHHYAINVGVTDLDPKPISCIEAHRKRDTEILKACIDILGSSVGDESFMPNTIKSDK